MATIEEKITGLYIAFFDRAPDQNGLNYWVEQAQTLDEATAVKNLAEAFATHPEFTSLYSDLDNQAYVEAIYLNTLGEAGDSDGIAYWSDQLDSGLSRSDMVAEFVTSALDFDINDPQYNSLSQEDLQNAQERQALLQNKVDVSLVFIDDFEDKTNLSPTTDPLDPASLEKDPAYLASKKVVQDITSDVATKADTIESMDLLKGSDDPIAIINSVTELSSQNILSILHDNLPSPSYQITGLGDISTVDTQWVDTLLSGIYWDESQKIITYSFNTSIPDDYYSYGTDHELTQGWTELNDAQKSAMENIFDGVDDLLDVTFVEVENDGMIELNIVDTDINTSGFSFYPGDYYSYQGDIFLSSAFNSNPQDFGLDMGENGWSTMAHELGHALGLKHPFDGDPVLPTELNNTNHSIMSYTPQDNIHLTFTITQTYHGKSIDAEGQYINSDLYSLYDVEALQAIYGVNDSTATGDDTYALAFNDFEIKTLWDAGGTDTIDLSNTYGSSTIDLNPGSLNSADEYSLNEIIEFYQDELNDPDFNDFVADVVTDLYNESSLYTGKDNLAITTGTIIENLKTGAGDDIITDNLVDNYIETAAGDDRIYLGYGGYDHIDGGSGDDTVYLDLDKEDITLTLLDTGEYDLYANDNSFEAVLAGIETITCNDGEIIL